MSELKEIAAILFRNLSDALLTTATQLSSQKTFTQADWKARLIETPELASLKIGDHVMFSVIERKKSQRYWGTIRKIEGEKISLTNSVLKREWEIAPSQVLYQEL